MAAVRHPGFSKIKFLVAINLGRATAYHHIKFYWNQWNGCGDIAFNGFQNGECTPSWFLKFEYFNGYTHYVLPWKIFSKFINGCWNTANFPIFLGGSYLPSWICSANFGMTSKEYLVVIITVQNLVGIVTIVLIIWKFEYFVCLAWKCLLTQCSVLGFKIGENRTFCIYPFRNALT